MSRLPASRWARIGAWTGAAIAWATTVGVAREMAPATATQPDPEPGMSFAAAGAQTGAAVPSMPDDGLVILRYVPVPQPQAKVIRRYVEATVPAGGPASSASGGGGSNTNPAPAPTGTAAVAPPPPPPAAPTPSTAPPAPVSGGS